jgi:hypothetical protein
MAGDPHAAGGFVVVNGVAIEPDGGLADLPDPYPGGNLFSLASGGAIFVRDPREAVGADQLNGGEIAAIDDKDWALIQPYLEENERHFGIPVDALLRVDGLPRPPSTVYRKVVPAKVRALQAEEAWVGHR